ncbi:hypothetical protein H5410_041494 [Solanum commersonii]|uniref:Uncharacterized protein n=1 Tax=Solanum commersonii TaxID=4109 RepID=A0A9J5XUQ4_SOLCO|nr:hypothetical protein H5410_041494 [Solanum commersonii]
MAVAEFAVAGGDYMGVWEMTPKSWNWKSFSKMIVSIALHHNGSYDAMIASVIEAGELTCEPNDLVISYQINGRGKIHPTLIKNDRHVSLYMLDIGIDGSRPTLRINAYSLEDFDNHFVEFKNKCTAVAVVLEHDIGFEKWSRAHFPGNRYDVMTINIAESLNVKLINEGEYPVASIFNSIAKRFGE